MDIIEGRSLTVVDDRRTPTQILESIRVRRTILGESLIDQLVSVYGNRPLREKVNRVRMYPRKIVSGSTAGLAQVIASGISQGLRPIPFVVALRIAEQYSARELGCRSIILVHDFATLLHGHRPREHYISLQARHGEWSEGVITTTRVRNDRDFGKHVHLAFLMSGSNDSRNSWP